MTDMLHKKQTSPSPFPFPWKNVGIFFGGMLIGAIIGGVLGTTHGPKLLARFKPQSNTALHRAPGSQSATSKKIPTSKA